MKKSISSGFTLIELLLYVGLLSFLLFTTSAFLSVLLESRVKNQTMAEVEQQGVQIMQILTQSVRNAIAITTPSIGTSSTTLSLQVTAPNTPIIFDVTSSTLRMKQGVGPIIQLTNSRVSVSNISFQNNAQPGTDGVLRIEFVVTAIQPTSRYEHVYSQTFVGSAVIRPN